MTRLTIYFFAALQFFMLQTIAQKNKVNSIQWKIAGSLPATTGQSKALGFAGPIAGIHEDVLIVAGGSNFPDSMPWLGGKKKYYDDVYVLKKTKDGSLKNYKSFKLPYAIAYAATCTTSQGVLSAGGENEKGISYKVFLIQWNEATKNSSIKNLPDLPFAVTNASVASVGNMIYMAGGEMINEVSNHFFSLDLNNLDAGWKTLPSLPKPVSHAVMVVQSNGYHNCIYLIGGRKKNVGSTSDLYSSVFQFNLTTNKWSEKKPLPYNLSAGTGIATGKASILLFGGDRGEAFHKTEKLIAAINNEKDETKKQQLNQQKIALQSSHPGFSKEVLLYNIITGKWGIIGSIPFDAPVTTTAIKWNGNVLIPSGEIKAGVRTPQILNGKLVSKFSD